MRAPFALATRVAVAALISLGLVTAAVTSFVVSNPREALTTVNDTTDVATVATPAP
jgi:hypothetical protein